MSSRSILKMFGLRKKKEEDYETVLFNLTKDVQKRRIKLSEIRLRGQRSTFLVTLYTLAAWAAYVSLWYLSALPDLKLKDGKYIRSTSIERAFKALPVAIGPILILLVRSVVQFWYRRKIDAEENPLKELIKKRRDKFEEIKQKGNFDHICDLIQKYDEPSGRFRLGQASPFVSRRPWGRGR